MVVVVIVVLLLSLKTRGVLFWVLSLGGAIVHPRAALPLNCPAACWTQRADLLTQNGQNGKERYLEETLGDKWPQRKTLVKDRF